MTHKERCAIPVTWKAGDLIKADGKLGTVRYVYTNGYTMVQFPHIPITGGMFNNDGTFGNECITKISR